jgi:hypothetical protein
MSENEEKVSGTLPLVQAFAAVLWTAAVEEWAEIMVRA